MLSDQAPDTVTKGGLAGTFPQPDKFGPVLASSIGGELNRVRAAAIPIACWRVDDIRFAFDSSFLQPDVRIELQHLAALVKAHPPLSVTKTLQPPQMTGCPLSIFGHADPVGDDEYNKKLSGRRAMSVYGLLTRDVDLWDELFDNPVGNDKWGKEALQTMADASDDRSSDQRTDVNHAQSNAVQRKALYRRYMDALCRTPEQASASEGEGFLHLEKTDFLAHGEDKAGKGDYQGCGEFNPLLLFSQAEEEQFQKDSDKTARNKANAQNRHVMVLIFRKGTRIDPARWPCPRANEGTAGCRKRFWADGEQRRSRKLPDQQRKFEETRDTFACRFYDRLVRASPCKPSVITRRIRLYDPWGCLIPNAPCQVSLGSKTLTLVADSEGVIVLYDVSVPSTCLLQWGRPASGSEEQELPFTLRMFLDVAEREASAGGSIGSQQTLDPDAQRLNNLGYTDSDQQQNVRRFQNDYGNLASPPLEANGVMDDRTATLLRSVYSRCEPDLHDPAVAQGEK